MMLSGTPCAGCRSYGDLGASEEKALIGTTDGRVKSFGREVFENRRTDKYEPTAAWQAHWNDFLKRWDSFLSAWFVFESSRLAAYRPLAQEFDDLLEAYAAGIGSVGGTVETSAAPIPPKPKSAIEGLTDTARKIMVVGAVGLGLYFFGPPLLAALRARKMVRANPRRRRRR